MGALGYVMHVPEEEKYLDTEAELRDRLVGLLGGRAAEEIVFDTVTTGAANDIEQATNLARNMVTRFGMSKKFGLMGLATVESQYLDGSASLTCSDVTAADIDTEVMKMLHDSYKQAKKLLKANREIMDKLADHLIEKETITGKEFMKIYRKEKGLPEPEEEEKEETDKKDAPDKPKAAETKQAPVNPNPQTGGNMPVNPNMSMGQNMPAGQNMPMNQNVPAGWSGPGNQGTPAGYYQGGPRADGANVGLFSHSSLNPESMPSGMPQNPMFHQEMRGVQETSGAAFSQTLAERTEHLSKLPQAGQMTEEGPQDGQMTEAPQTNAVQQEETSAGDKANEQQ